MQAGSSQVALDLNSDQVQGLDGGSTKVIKGVSPYVIYTWFNQNPTVGAGVTNKAEFLTAVRHGIDYSKILSIAGTGSTQPGGMVPSHVPRRADAPTRRTRSTRRRPRPRSRHPDTRVRP